MPTEGLSAEKIGPRPSIWVCKGCPAYETEKWREPSGDGETYDRGQYAWCNAAGRKSMGAYHYDHSSTPEWCPARAEGPAPPGGGVEGAPESASPEFFHSRRLAAVVLDQPARDPDDDLSVLARQLQRADELIARYAAALLSISLNTCCDRCQEAALVARAAIRPEFVG